MTLQNEPFEELLADHLKTTLDGQRGKALAAFRQHVAEDAGGTRSVPATLAWRKAEIPRRALWWWTGIPSAAAAGLAVVVMLQSGVLHRQKAGPQPQPDSMVASSVEISQNQTGAIVITDNKPMREVRRQVIRQTQWTDPQDKAVYTVTEPVVRVDYIQVQPN
jgi:hypothetical protein